MNNMALADRRDLIINRLSSGFAEGELEVEELERRLAQVHAAQTAGELDALVTDLVPVAASMALVPAQRTRVVLGSVERTGPWTVPPQLAARVLWGNLVLDLREAQFAAATTTIDVNITMGHVEVIVPPGVKVELATSAFLGSAEERVEHTAGAKGPTVQIVGRVRLGNLEVETRRVGETMRDARRRRRAERRARRGWRRARHMCEW
jgi:hypothetical protein